MCVNNTFFLFFAVLLLPISSRPNDFSLGIVVVSTGFSGGGGVGCIDEVRLLSHMKKCEYVMISVGPANRWVVC